jgi:hypothetical protein
MIRQTHPLDRRICGPAVETVQRREVSNVVDDPQVVVDGLPAGLPSTVTVPDVVIWLPTMQRISVVFPHPDGPSRPVMLPFAISTEKSCSAGRLPRITRRWLMLTAGSEPPGINSSRDEVII